MSQNQTPFIFTSAALAVVDSISTSPLGISLKIKILNIRTSSNIEGFY